MAKSVRDLLAAFKDSPAGLKDSAADLKDSAADLRDSATDLKNLPGGLKDLVGTARRGGRPLGHDSTSVQLGPAAGHHPLVSHVCPQPRGNSPWSENPPDRAEFNETRDKVNEALGGLKHPA